ncbi:MAG: hypothetical protein RLN75_01670 [Longimicrobiales bacterium]
MLSASRGTLRTLVVLAGTLLVSPVSAAGQSWLHDDGSRTNRSMFRPIDEWPDPNAYRNAAGAPGFAYWQQRADYVIEATLDTAAHVLTGTERITYHNNSPDRLGYLWLQLDQNVRSLEHSRSYPLQSALPDEVSPAFRRFVGVEPFDGGHTISRVQIVTEGGTSTPTTGSTAPSCGSTCSSPSPRAPPCRSRSIGRSRCRTGAGAARSSWATAGSTRWPSGSPA